MTGAGTQRGPRDLGKLQCVGAPRLASRKAATSRAALEHARRSAEVIAIALRSLPSPGSVCAAHAVHCDDDVGPYRTPVPVTQPLPPTRADRAATLVALIGVALIGLAIWAARRETSPLAELPEPERQQLLQRTLDNLALCERHPGTELRGFCEAQADIARALPECDRGCRELARTRYPSRAPSSRP